MTITVDGFKEVLDMLKGLFSGIKDAAQLPEANRKEMRTALADTAELIDETLTILKQHLSTILTEIRFGDYGNAERMICELADFPGWEQKYRQFQLCDALRNALGNMERSGLFKFKDKIGLADAATIQQKLWDYIGGETNAARSVGTMLLQLSQLADSSKYTKEEVVGTLESARKEVSEWRQLFIEIEQDIRSAI